MRLSSCLFLNLILVLAANPAHAILSRQDFDQTLGLGKYLFQPLAQAHFEELEVYADYDSEMDNAFSRREGRDVSLTFFGGLKNRPGMNRDVLALCFCHELGHLYAGEPYSNVDLQKSLEGQADYWATNSGCLKQMIENQANPGDTQENDSLPWIQNFCRSEREHSPETCERMLLAIERLSKMFYRNPKTPAPSFQTPDPNTVDETLRTHPEPQCRMDTYLAGALAKNRPTCWFKPGFDLDFIFR